MSLWGTHTDYFFIHVHKTARWRWGSLHSPEVVNTVNPLLSYCQFAFNVIVPDSRLCFHWCLGRKRRTAAAAPPRRTFWHLSSHKAPRPRRLAGPLWPSGFVVFFLICFCEISHWAGPKSTVFFKLFFRQGDYFCKQFVNMFLFLLTIIKGFNLWTIKRIKKTKAKEMLRKRWDQIKCNTPGMPVCPLLFLQEEQFCRFKIQNLSFSRHGQQKARGKTTIFLHTWLMVIV